ncbi:chemotaxis protein CheW [Campylobacterota bacterium]|nr:chemotaxis protein CheW [Campylobacterota bacterium]
MNNSAADLHESVVKMTESHLNNIMQLALFYTGNNEIYAVNVAKIQSFVILDEIEIVPNRDPNHIIVGVAQVRGELVTFVNLDAWLGMPIVDLSLFTVGVVCNVNCRRVGFFAREIIGIEDRLSSELMMPGTNQLKILYVTQIMIAGIEKSCAIFDIERLMVDCGFPTETPAFVMPDKESPRFKNKKILIAEDSVTAARKLSDFLTSLKIKYELYSDGGELINRLETIDENEIGLIITDSEMPVRDGFQVISYVKTNERLKHIPIVVNSSMTSGGVIEKVKRLGAAEFVNKSDVYSLYNFIKLHLEKEKL